MSLGLPNPGNHRNAQFASVGENTASPESSRVPSLFSAMPNIFDSEDSVMDLVPEKEANEGEINGVATSPNIFDSDDSVMDKDFFPEEETSESEKNGVATSPNIFGSDDIVMGLVPEEETSVSEINTVATSPSAQVSEDVAVDNMENSGKKYSRRIRKERTKKIHSGKSYVSVSGKVIKARQLQHLKQCRKKCNSFLKEEIRKIIFDEYWSLGNHDKRVTFIANLINVKEKEVSRKRKADSLKTREVTYEYSLEINGTRLSVCKGCFSRTLDEREKFISNAIKNKMPNTSGITKDDQRGKKSPKNKKSLEELNEVRAHITSFPSYESHYTRRTNDKNFLPSYLNLRIMYDLYKEGRENFVSRSIYEREFMSGKNYPLQTKYKTLVPISEEKKRDLCSLLSLIPPVVHSFYKNLPTSYTAVNDDPDLVDEEEKTETT